MSNSNEFLPGFENYTEFRSVLKDAEEAEKISIEKARRASRHGILTLGENALGEIFEDEEAELDIDDED